MKTIINLLLFSILLVITSCGKKIDCLPQDLSIAFTQYDTLNSDTIILKAYIKESNFSTLFSSDTIYLKDTLNQNYITTIRNDSAFIKYIFMLGNHQESNGYLNIKYDWKIITKQNIYNLTDFKYTITTKRCGLFECFPCFEPITQLKLNTIIITPNESGLLYLNY